LIANYFSAGSNNKQGPEMKNVQASTTKAKEGIA